MSIKKWSELDIIKIFSAQSGLKSHPDLIKGIGDDCAIFSTAGNRHWVTTTDILVEDVHFNRTWHPPRLLGRKSIAVNLSDIAAMGADAHFALVSIALPDNIDKEWVSSWSSGLLEILDEFDCLLIGGDTVKGSQLVINVVVLGSVDKDQAILRSTAQENETIYVSGMLGSAAAGLEICRNPSLFSSLDHKICEPLIEQHLNPTPELRLGKILRKSQIVGSMQDLSDGLATDLAHICAQSSVGAEIDAFSLPGHENLDLVCEQLDTEPTTMKISGGEDYRLVFTVRQNMDEQLQALQKNEPLGPIYPIGRTVKGQGVKLITQDGKSSDISFKGYQHRSG
jgi:thiamine-monophosphate kinase